MWILHGKILHGKVILVEHGHQLEEAQWVSCSALIYLNVARRALSVSCV